MQNKPCPPTPQYLPRFRTGIDRPGFLLVGPWLRCPKRPGRPGRLMEPDSGIHPSKLCDAAPVAWYIGDGDGV